MLGRHGDSLVSPSLTATAQVSDTVVSQPQRPGEAFMLALAANILWGTSFLASKYTLEAWGPWTASALRFFVALVLMAAFSFFSTKKITFPKNLRSWLLILAVGMSGFGFLYPLQLSGLKVISSAKSAALMLTSPLFVVLLAQAFLSERLTLKKIVAIILGIAGGVLLLSKNLDQVGGTSLGDALTLLASLSLAASVIFTRKLGSELSPLTLTFWSMAIGLLFIAPFSLKEASLDHTLNAKHFAALLYLAAVCSVLCFWIWNRAISIAPAKHLASTMHVKTPVAILLGIVVLGEAFSLSIWIGLALVTLGVFVSQLPERRIS